MVTQNEKLIEYMGIRPERADRKDTGAKQGTGNYKGKKTFDREKQPASGEGEAESISAPAETQ